MSIYSELLKMVLSTGGDHSSRTVAELVADVVARRPDLPGDGPSLSGSAGPGPAGPVGDALAYDAALVRLCDRLGIDHDMTGPSAGPQARSSAEAQLAKRLPSIAAVVRSGRGTHQARQS